MNRVTLFLVFIFLTSCANTAKKESVTDLGRLTKLSRQSHLQLNKQEEKKLHSIVNFEKSYQQEKIHNTYVMPSPRTEESMYAEVLHAYQARNLDRLEFFVEKFNSLYAGSVYSDNVIYLKGQLNLALGMPSEALREFDRLLKEFPTGNKRSSALFGKGVAYRKLQLYKYAEKIFRDVKKEYPGSPEFYKVDLEMKLLQVEKGA